MVTTATLDKAGRIVLPKPMRRELQLSPGDALEVESSQDQIVLRPARNGRMRKEHGVWIFDSGQPLSAETVRKTIQRIRTERENRSLGKSG